MQGIFPLQYFNSPTVQVHTNGSHQNGKRGSHVSTVSIYRHGDPDGDTAMGGEWTLELATNLRGEGSYKGLLESLVSRCEIGTPAQRS